MNYDLRTARLDIVFEQAVLAIYRGWYALPRRAALPKLEELRASTATQLAALIAAEETQTAGRIFAQFATAAGALPGVAALCTGSGRLAHAENPLDTLARGPENSTGPRATARLTPARLEELVTLLRQPEPAAYAIGLLVYDPNQARATWEQLWAQLHAPAVWNNLSPQERAGAEAAATLLATQAAADAAPFAVATATVAALVQLESLPAVVRMLSAAAPELLSRYKCPPPPPIYLSSHLPAADRVADAPPAAGALAAEKAQGASDEEVRPFHTDVRFPATVKLYDEARLTVRLTVQRVAGAIIDEILGVAFSRPAPEEPLQPEFVELRLLAPGFEEVSLRSEQEPADTAGTRWERTIKVDPNCTASQTAVFVLRAAAEGEQRLGLDFYQRGRMLGSVAFTVSVSRSAQTGPARPAPLQQPLPQPDFAANPPLPADLELRVMQADDQHRLYFVLNSTRPEVPFRNQSMGEIRLTARDPALFLAEQANQLSRLARNGVGTLSPAESAHLQEELAVLGEGLFEQLLPPQLQAAYWATIKPLREQGILRSLLIISDEPWIPWELIKPYRWDAASATEQTDSFWAESFQLCRWLAGRGPGGHITAQDATLVMPAVGLPAASRETSFFTALAAAGKLQVHGPLRLRDEVLDAVRAGGFQVLHVATHGVFNAQNVTRSEIVLQDATIQPEDLKGGRLRGLRTARPLIFLNACNGGRAAYALTGVGGWAQTLFFDANAGAFVGALWEVEDELAAAFAHAFYTALEAGETLGAAIQSARRHVRTLAPANPTWLAYTLYGDPNARIHFGRTG